MWLTQKIAPNYFCQNLTHLFLSIKIVKKTNVSEFLHGNVEIDQQVNDHVIYTSKMTVIWLLLSLCCWQELVIVSSAGIIYVIFHWYCQLFPLGK